MKKQDSSPVWITPELLKVLKAHLKPWVVAVAYSNLPIPMAMQRYSPHRTAKGNTVTLGEKI